MDMGYSVDMFYWGFSYPPKVVDLFLPGNNRWIRVTGVLNVKKYPPKVVCQCLVDMF